MIGFALKRQITLQFNGQSRNLSKIGRFQELTSQIIPQHLLVRSCSYPFSQNKAKEKKEDETKKTDDKEKKIDDKEKKTDDAANNENKEENAKSNQSSFENVRNYFNEFNTFDKLGEAKDQFEMFRIRRQKQRVEKKMAREIKEREKYDKMTDEERGQMETAISKEFIDNIDIIDEPDKFFYMYYTQSTFWDRVKVKLQFLKCRLFYAKEFAKKQEVYDKIFIKLNYNPHMLNQALPMLNKEAQKLFEKKFPDYYTKTRWELYKSMKPALEREYGINFETMNQQIEDNGQPIAATQTENEFSTKDPDEAPEEVTQEQAQERLKLYNQFQTSLAIVDEDQVIKPNQRNLQVSQEQTALDRIKLLNMVGWNRTQTIKIFSEKDKTQYNNMTYRHEYFCVREEMNNFLKNKDDIDLSRMSEKERLTMFSTATFDPAESLRRKWRLAWLNHQNKIGFGFAEGEKKTGVWFDLGVFGELGKSRVSIAESSQGIKETYDEQVANNATSAYGGAAFLLSHSSKDNSMEKCLDFIRQYDKEFSQLDLEEYVRNTFERAYTAHLKGMLYEIDTICQEQALGYFRSVWNIWSAAKARPKYQRIWGLEKPAFSSSEINSQNQPVFSFSIHCQTNHCLVDAKDGVTLKEGSDERVMRNGYQVVCMFDPLETNQLDQWKLISIAPIEKTLLLA